MTVPSSSPFTPVVLSKGLRTGASSARVRRIRRIAAASLETCATILVFLACLASGCQRIRDQPPSREASLNLGLRVEPDGDNIRLTWNRQAPILTQASGGILHIEDGTSVPREIRLSRDDLQKGSVAYAHGSGKLHFRLDVLVGESVSAFTGNATEGEHNKSANRRHEEPVRSPTAAHPGTRAQTGEIVDRHEAGAGQAGMRQRSHDTSDLNTASGETGIASFYYPGSNRDELTAAYSKVPLGTRVRVTNVANGRSVVVRITNRGPSVTRGRVINVSYRAAEELGFARAGTARVHIASE